jgi:small subunit ribosomal protein S9
MEKKTTKKIVRNPKQKKPKKELQAKKKEKLNTEEKVNPKTTKITIKKIDLIKDKYIRAVGRRKSSVATIHLFNEKGDITINNKVIDDYFKYKVYGDLILEPLKLVGASGKFKISIQVKGGGKRGQVGAIQLGIARVLVKLDPDLRKTLKANGLLKRDPRVKERKKPGLKRARKSPQWSKR